MGFLSFAYGKLMAGKLMRNLQNQQMSIQSRLNRVTREVGDMEDYLSRAENSMKTQMQSQFNNSIFGLQGGFNLLGQVGVFGQAGQDQYNQYQSYMAYQQVVQQQFAMAQSLWQNNFEMQRDAMLEPLKNEQDYLQNKLDNVKSRLALAEQQYKSYQEGEKSSAKDMAPELTGQG